MPPALAWKVTKSCTFPLVSYCIFFFTNSENVCVLYLLLIHNYQQVWFNLVISSWFLSQYCGSDKNVSSTKTNVDILNPKVWKKL